MKFTTFSALITALLLPVAGSAAQKILAFYPAGDAAGVFLRGETPVFRIKVKSDKKTVKGSIIVRDSAGKTVHTLPLTLRNGKLTNVNLPKPVRNGFFEVWAQFGKQKGIASYIYTPFIPKRDPFFTTRPADWFAPALFRAYVKLGFGGMRIGIGGLKAFSDDYDPVKTREKIVNSAYIKRVKKLVETNKNFVYCCDVGLDGYIGTRRRVPNVIQARRKAGYFTYPKEYYDTFVMGIEELHKATGGKVKYWVLSQEIDSAIHDPNRFTGGGPQELAHHFIGAELAYNTLKRLSPDCKVALMSSSGRDYHVTKPPFLLTKFILTHLRGKFDIIALDAYNGNYSLRGGRTRIEPPENGLRRHLLDAKTLSREFGKDGTITVEERQKGMPEAHRKMPINGRMTRMVADIEARDMIIIKSVSGVPYYAYLDYSYRSDQTLFRATFDENSKWHRTPFPAAMSIATTMRTLAYAKPVRRPEIKLDHKVYAYLFRKGKQIIMPVWHADEKNRVVHYTVTLPKGCILRDIDGNDTPLKAGKYTFKLNNTPQFVFLPVKAAAVKKMMNSGKFLDMQTVKGHVRPFSNGKALLFLCNETSVNRKVTAQNQTFPLKPREKRVFTISMPKGDTLFIGEGKNKYELPVNKEVVRLSRKGTKILLTSPRDVYPRAASIPERTLLLFDGKDIEADIRLSWDEKYLHLSADVRDRAHRNNFRTEFLWRGDSLQLGIVPGNLCWDPELTGKPSIPFNMSAALTDIGIQVYQFGVRKLREWPCTITRSGIITKYKLSMPWTDIGISKPARGTAFGMNIVFFDLNNPGQKSSQHHVAITEGLTGGQNPSLYKTFILE